MLLRGQSPQSGLVGAELGAERTIFAGKAAVSSCSALSRATLLSAYGLPHWEADGGTQHRPIRTRRGLDFVTCRARSIRTKRAR